MKRSVFGTMLIVIGLCIIGSALFMRYSAERKQKLMMENFQKTLQDIGESEVSPESTQANPTDNAAESINKPSSQNIKAIAVMEIPKIDLNVAIADGTDTQTLKYALGHFEGTAKPGEKGNFSVAGHRSYTYSQYFNRLDEIKSGDKIKVKAKNGEFTYEVYDTFVVKPEEISVLNPTEDATITLVTCTPIRVATHRLIIKGKLKV